jgi:hypothetical protein
MSEEKPVFKITDRRLFNPDGSPRDVERAEEPQPTPAAVNAATDERRADESASTGSATASTGGAGAAASAGVGAGASGAVASEPARASASSPASPSPQPEPTASTTRAREEDDETELGGDPTAFANLLMFIASPAAAAMGMTEHPGLAGHDIDLQLAKHCIDLLGTLRQKTLGRLSAQEEQMFDGILAELRMQFVSLSTARPATGVSGSRRGGGGGGGFSGSDITGGR